MPVTGLGMPSNSSSVSWITWHGFPDRLVAEADTEDRDLPRQGLHQGHEDPRVARRARTRGEHGGARLQRQNLCDRERVVAVHDGLLAQLSEQLDEVVGERVVIV